MGKVRRDTKSAKVDLRHNPLEKQLEDDRVLDPTQRKQRLKQRQKERAAAAAEEEEIAPLTKKATKAILREAQKQKREIEKEESESDGEARPAPPQLPPPRFALDDADDVDDDVSGLDEDEEHYLDEVEEVTLEDERQLEMFMNPLAQGPRTIGDILLEKMREKQSSMGQTEGVKPTMDPKFVEVYGRVAHVLSIYRSGKLPKAFKIIPALSNWEEVLYMTHPDSWTPQAMMVATKLFASNLNSKMAQRFYNLVLLPRVRNQIRDAEDHKLSYHLYMSLKLAIFKPSAFFKGILLPLCESGSCTLREALIVGSVLAKVSIPFQHSSAALVKLAQMDYSPANSVFMRILLNKKYNLPFRVIDELVNHFMRFLGEKRALPVLWHQCLLVFVQRYKNDLTEEENEALRTLAHKQRHPLITPDIHRELQHAAFRGQVALPAQVIPERLYTGTGSAMDAWAAGSADMTA